MTIRQTQNSITTQTRIARIEDDSHRVVGDFKNHTTGCTYSYMSDQELRQQVLNEIHSAASKLHDREVEGDDANMLNMADAQALYLLALVNEFNAEMNDLWNIDNDLSYTTCMKKETNLRARIRRVEHRFYGRSLNMIAHI